jgi:ribonuclease BN (tRNA processing enzyme)
VDFTRSLPLHILGPRGLESFYRRMRGIFGHWIEAQTYPLYLHELEEARLDFPGFSLRTLPMAHSETSIGFRVDGGERSLVYSGDTDYCENIVQLGKNSDLLILECSFPDERKVSGHLTPSSAGRIAREAKAKRLLLTHFYPVFRGVDIEGACRKEFSGPILLARDGMKLSI